VATDDVPAALDRELLGGERRYTRVEVADLAGVPVEQARILWRALGFADVGDDNVAFTDQDVQALRAVEGLVQRGVIDSSTQLAMTRAMGQSLARLADWHVSAITKVLDPEQPTAAEDAAAVAHELVPVVEGLIGYIWRRHLAATAERALSDDRTSPSTSLVVGFADLVGFTSLTRDVGEAELAGVVETFEALASDVITQHSGRVVKTLGDEVMFTADNPGQGAEIALDLAERVEAATGVPDVRVGLACGPVLARLGDVYGEPVNIASRLTSIARPASILVDRELAGELAEDERFSLRRVPPRPVRGYALLHASRLRRAEPDAATDD
jgi:adenylate cyclase